MQQSTDLTLKIPNLPASTPFKWVGINAHYCSDGQSTQWILNYGHFHSERKRAVFTETHADLLGAYAYPCADAKGLRIGCDWVTMLAALDQYTDDQDGEGARVTRDTFVEALTGKSGDDTSPITLFTKDFMGRLSEICVSDDLQKRFVKHLTEYIDAITEEAALRTAGQFPTFEEYIIIRRNCSGYIPICDVMEITQGISLPTAVLEDSNFRNIFISAIDMMSLANDIYSYAMEYESGQDGCNAVTVLIKSKGLSVQEAIDHAAALYRGRSDTIISCKSAIRSFGKEVDEMVRAYLDGLEQVICGNNAWSLDTPRYFGEEREEVKRSGIVKIKTK